MPCDFWAIGCDRGWRNTRLETILQLPLLDRDRRQKKTDMETMPPFASNLLTHYFDRDRKHFLNSCHISPEVGPAERRRGGSMDCPICRDLKRAYEAGLSDYIEARSSVCFRVCPELAAQKNVEMERARYELEEHQRLCIPTVRLSALSLRRDGAPIAARVRASSRASLLRSNIAQDTTRLDNHSAQA
jgi:hypothetical protein